MMRLGLRRLCEAGLAKPAAVVEPIKKPACSIMTRFKSFISGALFASAAGMYVITFQLQGLLDEVKSAVHDVSIRQQVIEDKISKINQERARE